MSRKQSKLFELKAKRQRKPRKRGLLSKESAGWYMSIDRRFTAHRLKRQKWLVKDNKFTTWTECRTLRQCRLWIRGALSMSTERPNPEPICKW